MEPWVCNRCRWTNGERDATCAQCGLAHPMRADEQGVWAFPGVTVVRDVHGGSVSAAFDAPQGWAGAQGLEPFFQLDATPRKPRLRRLRRLWPVVVFLVVLVFFAVAGLSR